MRTTTFRLCVLSCAALTGCVRTVQAWPLPLDIEDVVMVSFASPKTVTFMGKGGRDSLVAVRELAGSVVSLSGDTLIVRVTRVTRVPHEALASSVIGRPATVMLDGSTSVRRSEVDGWKAGYLILSSAVLVFAVMAMSAGG